MAWATSVASLWLVRKMTLAFYPNCHFRIFALPHVRLELAW